MEADRENGETESLINKNKSEVPGEDNFKVLLAVLVLNIGITISMIIGAVLSHSLALLSDSIHMVADIFTYCANLYAEHQRQEEHKAGVRRFTASKLELYVATFSVVMIFGSSIYIGYEAIERMHSKAPPEVSSLLMMLFATVNLIFDVGSILAFYVWGTPLQHGHSHGDGDDGHAHGDGHGHAGENWDPMEASSNPRMVNLWTAFLHVLSDMFRSIAIFVAAILIYFFKFNSARTDAWCSLVVTVLVLLATFHTAKTVFQGWTANPET